MSHCRHLRASLQALNPVPVRRASGRVVRSFVGLQVPVCTDLSYPLQRYQTWLVTFATREHGADFAAALSIRSGNQGMVP